MKSILFLITCLYLSTGFGQTSAPQSSVSTSELYLKDTLVTAKSNPEAGFLYDYLLFIPEGTVKNKKVYLLVEPNNTGFTSDSIEIHREGAVYIATQRSLGNIVSKELHVPLLVPVFPRPKNRNLTYTHALDRDAMITNDEDIKRLDLQLLAMVKDARQRLERLEVPVEEKIMMTGFSASGSFVNRFAFLHPEKVKALAAGGLNGILMLPKKSMNNETLNYPLGVNDLEEISGKKPDLTSFKKLPQFLFMGAIDDNDAVPYDDAYSDEERRVVYATVGKEMQPARWEKCQEIYKTEGVNAIFRTYKEVGHWSTPEINRELINFFSKIIQEEQLR